MDRRLLNYLPPVLREVLEIQTINKANEPEIAVAWDALTLVLANQFLDTADENGVSVWERELRIYPKDTDSMEVRKARIKAMWNLELPYTVPWLRNWLAGLCGATGYELTVSGYVVNIQLDYNALPNASSLAGEILDMLLAVHPVQYAGPYDRFLADLRHHNSRSLHRTVQLYGNLAPNHQRAGKSRGYRYGWASGIPCLC